MRHPIIACAFVLVAGLLLGGDLKAGSLEPPGPPAPTMKTLAQVESRIPITSLPFTISQPGSYYLTGHLTGVAGQTGITVAASYVTLDLNGFSLIGVPGSIDGIFAQFGARHLEIRNGVIRGWGRTGAFVSGYEVHAENLRVDANLTDGLYVGPASVVHNVISTGNGASGIIAVDGSTVIGCTARDNATGIMLGFGSVATDCAALQNGTGFSIATGGRVARSAARDNDVMGIVGLDGVTVEECNVDENTGTGIRVGNRGLVRGNVARGNSVNGIEATGGQNRIEENQSTANATGIRVSGSSNVIVRNSVGSNTTEYVIVAGNKLGPVSTDPATAGPWANFDL